MKTKFVLCFLVVTVTAICFSSCNRQSKSVASNTTVFNKPDPPVWVLNDDDVELGTDDFFTFDIQPDYSSLNETVYTDPSKQMYVENSNFKDSVSIKFDGNKAIVNCDKDAACTVKTDGANVTIKTTKDVACTLTGKSESGSLKILGNNKVRVNLNGVNLKSANGPAINSQSSNICFIVTDAASTLCDDSTYAEPSDDEKQKGCICSNGYLAISGKAPLKVIAKGANAIHSSEAIFVRRGSNLDIDSRAGSAIKAKNKVMVEGGLININSTGHGGHGIAAKQEVEIAGGRTTIISNAGAGKDGKNSRGIKSDSIVAITGGIVRIKESSIGGKGIRANKFLAKNCIVDVLTFGEDDKITGSKNRGIKGADEIRIDSSRVRVRTENGWNEGLSTRRKVLINNSLVELKTRDDAISAGDPETADIEINNSHVFAYSGMDAIDSNGTLHIDGGVIFVIAQTHLCRGFDCDQKEFKIGSNATIVSLGEITSPPTASLLEHPACLVTHSINDAEFCLSTTGSNDNIVSYQKPKFRYSDANYKVLLSVPQFKQNVSYDFCRRATISNPKHTFHGLSIGGTADNKVVVAKHTFNKNYNDYSLPTPPRPPKNGMLNRTGAMAATPAGATAGTPGATAAPTEPQASTKTTKKGSKSKPQNNAAPVNAPDNAQQSPQTSV